MVYPIGLIRMKEMMANAKAKKDAAGKEQQITEKVDGEDEKNK